MLSDVRKCRIDVCLQIMVYYEVNCIFSVTLILKIYKKSLAFISAYRLAHWYSIKSYDIGERCSCFHVQVAPFL
jgi:hypothetical protein